MAFYSSTEPLCFSFDYEVDILNLQRRLYLPFEVWKLFAVTRGKEEKSGGYNDPP